MGFFDKYRETRQRQQKISDIDKERASKKREAESEAKEYEIRRKYGSKLTSAEIKAEAKSQVDKERKAADKKRRSEISKVNKERRKKNVQKVGKAIGSLSESFEKTSKAADIQRGKKSRKKPAKIPKKRKSGGKRGGGSGGRSSDPFDLPTCIEDLY